MPAPTESSEIVPAADHAALANVQLGSLAVTGPKQLVSTASEIATELKRIIDDRKLAVRIQGREFVTVEGWTTAAALCGCTVREVSVEESDGIYVATVELVTTDGRIIGRASAECGSPDEVDRRGKPVWSERPRYARRSMAITRATGKVARMCFSWIAVLGDYAPTPAEEHPDYHDRNSSSPTSSRTPAPARRRVHRVLGGAGAQRLYDRLNQVSTTYTELIDYLREHDPVCADTIADLSPEELPAAALQPISEALIALGEMKRQKAQDGATDAPDEQPADEIDEASIPF
ncbi:MAG: hypothetical protein SYC29_12485 [Planctomycetota bacterium]|nr:hypothetical protein [Planctomycetota bacterium]